jgi:SAM-dependent methyltransferase
MELNEFEKMYQDQRRHWWYLSRQRIITDYIKRFYFNDSNLRILDIASACGANLGYFSKFGKVIGTDISPESLKFCRINDSSLFVQGDAHNLPFVDNSFDIALGIDCLEHFENDTEVVGQIYRLLKSGGRFVITVPAYMQLWSTHDEAFHHLRRYTVSEVRKILITNGFNVEFSTYWTFSLLPLVYVFRKIGRYLGKDQDSKSDFFFKLPTLIEKCLSLVQYLESVPIKYGLPFPCGVNLFCVAIKK